MNKFAKIVVFTALITFFNMSYAEDYRWCDKKISNLEKQRRYAEQYDNHNRVKGLERAINNVKAKCGYLKNKSDNSISSQENDIDYAYHLRKKILDTKKDMIDVEYDLKKAQLKGDKEKILKTEYKLKKIQDKLALYEKELSQFQ